MKFRLQHLALVLLFVLGLSLLHADSTESMNAIFKRLQDHQGVARNHALIFEGEITRLQVIPRRACKAGVEHRLTYRISEILWAEPDSPATSGYTVSKGFIDCTERPLSSPPFIVGTRVLVYCETKLNLVCLSPVEITNKNRMKVRSWLDELRAAEGDPALLQIHERLRQSDELLRKTRLGAQPVLNEEGGDPFLFVGQVTSVQNLSDFPNLTVLPRLEMDIAVSRVLWGSYKDTAVIAWCNSARCGGATAGETVIMHCYAARPPTECSAPASYSDDSLKKVETWIAEASRIGVLGE